MLDHNTQKLTGREKMLKNQMEINRRDNVISDLIIFLHFFFYFGFAILFQFFDAYGTYLSRSELCSGLFSNTIARTNTYD